MDIKKRLKYKSDGTKKLEPVSLGEYAYNFVGGGFLGKFECMIQRCLENILVHWSTDSSYERLNRNFPMWRLSSQVAFQIKIDIYTRYFPLKMFGLCKFQARDFRSASNLRCQFNLNNNCWVSIICRSLRFDG